MLGIMDQLRYNGLAYSPATRTWRSSRMRVKLQLVLCSDEGQEETVPEVMTLNKNSQHSEHLGLTRAETKQLLCALQRHLLQRQGQIVYHDARRLETAGWQSYPDSWHR